MNEYDLTPIETEYRGHKFRSRLEARWAVFFDSLKLRWDYEKEGFNLDGIWYLPDFYLPALNKWIEIKPEPKEGIDSFPKHFAFEYFKPGEFVLLQGKPGVWSYVLNGYADLEYVGYIWGDSNYFFCECHTCGLIDIQYDGRADRTPCKKENKCPKISANGDKGYNTASQKLIDAYFAASSVRF